MAVLFRRQNGVYYIKLRGDDGRELRQSTGTKNRKEAQKIRLEVERQLAETLVTGRPTDAMMFEEAWDIYFNALRTHKKEKSLACEKGAWDKFSAWCEARGITTLQSVRVGDVALWQNDLVAAKYAVAGVNNRMRMCKVVYNHLIRLEVFTGLNPFSRVKALKDDHQVKFLPWEQVTRLVNLSREVGRDIHLMFVLGAYAGLRRDEILRARWEHVDWPEKRLLVDGTKSSASRDYVPLHDTLRDALAPFRADAGYIVRPENMPGKQEYRWDHRKQWGQVLRAEAMDAAAKGQKPIGHVTPHQLRHSVATHLLDIGYTLQQVAVFLRHASDIPTRKYANLKGVRLEIDAF